MNCIEKALLICILAVLYAFRKYLLLLAIIFLLLFGFDIVGINILSF